MVVSAKAYSIRLPLVSPYATAYGTLTHSTNVVLRLTAADGTVGWGEAAPLTGFTDPETTETVMADLRDRLLPLVVGAPAVPNAVFARTKDVDAGLMAKVWRILADNQFVIL